MSEHSDQESWDDRYRSKGALWSGKPNRHLVGEVDGMTPGTALDVGAGEGADAIWLAEQGWQVTGVDISGVALERAAGHADEAGPDIAGRIQWLHHDLAVWQPPTGHYDLVSVQYLHLPPEPRQALFSRLASAVAAGGTLLIIGHHPSDLRTTIPRPPKPELLFTGDEIASQLDPDQWDIVKNIAAPAAATDPDGRQVTIHDTVLRVTRH